MQLHIKLESDIAITEIALILRRSSERGIVTADYLHNIDSAKLVLPLSPQEDHKSNGSSRVAI
jgi:hypothetical protein